MALGRHSLVAAWNGRCLSKRTLLRGEIGSEVEHHRRHALKVILRLREELAIQVIGFRTQRQPRV
jgi:hypothetical protein